MWNVRVGTIFNSENLIVRIEDNRLGFYFILFYFDFIFSYSLWLSRRQRRQSVTLSQKSHAHMM